MMRKPKKQRSQVKNSSKEQSARFIETAREVEADETSETLEQVFEKIAKVKKVDVQK